MKFVKNAWYVAGWADEFRDTLRSIRILNHNIVTFRSSNGSVVALDDRCPHKYLPLSKGQLSKDQIITPLEENIVEVSANVPFTSQLVWWLRSFGKKLLNIEPIAVYNAVKEIEDSK